MKKKKLIKTLKDLGAKKIREGGNHEFWQSKNGYRFSIPRHSEINEYTAKGILQDAEK